ncbi:MAG: hypothetical protein F4201_10020 [Nitrospira sp. SB0677_bin_15]|nr:hypothetical protein [Nitrospira sp. SB0677_bin_15]
MSKRNRQQLRETISLIYTRRGSLLYGCIRFFRANSNQQSVKAFRQSAPFVISQSIGKNEIVVYGSINELVREIRRLMDAINECHDKFHLALRQSGVATDESLDSSGKIIVRLPEGDKEDKLFFEYIREVTNILLLISSQTRNLFQLYNRFNNRCISQFDYEGNEAGSIPLNELFNYFVHNRYLFVDGEYVVDLFSDKFAPKSSISQTFMGYKIKWREYIDAIRGVTDDIRIKDLTGLLRGRIKSLSSNSPHKDIVFLVQNLESFSNLLATKIPDKRYEFMLNLLFDKRATQALADLGERKGRFKQVVTFTAPHIKIHQELNEKKFTVQVRCCFALHNDDEQRAKKEALDDHSIDVDYDRFLALVDNTFGDDSLVGQVSEA